MIKHEAVKMLAAGAILFLSVSAGVFGAEEAHDWKRMIRMCEEARTIQRKLVKAKEGERKAIAGEALRKLQSSGWDRRARKSPGGAYLRFWKAGLHIAAGQRSEYLEEARSLARHPTIAVDVWRGVRECAWGDEINTKIKRQIARLLPLYDFRDQRKLFQCSGHVLMRVYFGGRMRTAVEEAAANLTERVYGCPQPIRDAWLRHVYSSRYSKVICPWYAMGWEPSLESEQEDQDSDTSGSGPEIPSLSTPTPSPMKMPWLKLAEWEGRISGRGRAANYLAKTMVAGTDGHVRRGKILIKQWRRSGSQPRVGETRTCDRYEPKFTVDPETAVELAEMYRKMDLDPLAIRLCDGLIKIAGPEPETDEGEVDVEELKKEYQQDWIKKCEQNRAKSEGGKYHLWGQPANTEKQIRQITVPPPLQKEVVQEVAKQLPGIIEEIQKTADQKE